MRKLFAHVYTLCLSKRSYEITNDLGISDTGNRHPVRQLLAAAQLQLLSYAFHHHIADRYLHADATTVAFRLPRRHSAAPAATDDGQRLVCGIHSGGGLCVRACPVQCGVQYAHHTVRRRTGNLFANGASPYGLHLLLNLQRYDQF